MKAKMILPALMDKADPYFRPIKYALFAPLGLASLAGYFSESDEVELQDENVEELRLNDDPELVVIQVYITSAYRAYALADHYRRRGAHVCLGGLHVTSMPQEAAAHADTIFLGPGEDMLGVFLDDFRNGRPQKIYRSTVRSLVGVPLARRDLIKRGLYMVPNTVAVSRGCPHHCDFCYKDAFYQGGSGFYSRQVSDVLDEIRMLPGRYLFFVDDHLFGNPALAGELMQGLRPMGRLWQAGGTVQSVLTDGLMEQAAAAGLRTLFIGFETLSDENLRGVHKLQNLKTDYSQAVRRLHDLGIMVHGSFVFGMDQDDESVFDRTVDWAVEQGLEAATFHILTPYPGTPLFGRFQEQGRITSNNWSDFDTRHVVFKPARMSAAALEAGYWRAYERFYKWGSIFQAARTKETFRQRLRHVAYAAGWKKAEPVWNLLIRAGMLGKMATVMESILSSFGGEYASRESLFLRPAAVI
ncbi:MAG: B12-binding domain-containing radical SAM protein [Planctomycetes bacterium]|nr:B12-binding domain-containing radical SAM protein [Planctomycetota bacterium]